MALKHRLKMGLREAYARLLFHTGLHALVNRALERRMTILFGHCIEDDAVNGFLPRDMTMREETLRRVVGWFQKRGYRVTGVAAGFDTLKGTGKESIVALSLDDGYLDNRTRLLPVLRELDASATIFLESEPLDQRDVNWTHKYHWVIRDGCVDGWTRRYMARTQDAATAEKLRTALEGPAEGLAYQVKRVLKYEAIPVDRDAVCQALFEESGGDLAELCRSLYMDWDDARALRDGGVELGGHTISHPILSRLDRDGAAHEIGGGREALVRELGAEVPRVFAYPFGRAWDYDQTSIHAARDAGFELAVNTHAGVNKADSDPFQLKRLPVDDSTPMHLLVAEACGGFELLRKFGLDLSE
jgi:peptidoglycan/xylan/chitin deacetylase (PgdA/CDA1 family)